MRLRMWMYDLAREQAPTLDHLRTFCDATSECGYNALGLYLEHRFAYPCTPWSHGTGAVTPEMVRTLQEEYDNLQIIPFVNLLGHFEGMLYTEHGKRYAEELFQGMQACPLKPELFELAEKIIDDSIDIFNSDIIHIGGDETWQLGKCGHCFAKVAEWEQEAGVDGKARLYGQHFAPLAQRVIDKGRRPGVWGDMLLQHEQAIDFLPKETLIFDWEYFKTAEKTSRQLMERGFDVVCCPALHTYNATWFHLMQSEQNVRRISEDAATMGAYGVCVTTWENGLFGAYDTLLPAIRACGQILQAWSNDETDDRRCNLEDQQLEAVVKDLLNENDSGALKTKTATASLPITDLSLTRVERRAVLSVPLHLAKALKVMPVFRRDCEIWVAISHESDPAAADHIQAMTGCRVVPMCASASAIRTAMRRYYGISEAKSDAAAVLEFDTEESLFLKAYLQVSERYEEWARLMGYELQSCGGTFTFGGIRSSLKVRLLLNANPFLAWLHHREELSGEIGDEALDLFERALAVAPDEATKGVTIFARSAVEFVRIAEQAAQSYAAGDHADAIAKLALTRPLFDDLEKVAKRTHERIGGSLADIHRARVAREHVERVIKRIRDYGDGSLGYLPAFEHLTHHKFMPHDQAAWWLINRWANQ
jgi:tetratricopeptide (TPR) repeat protein